LTSEQVECLYRVLSAHPVAREARVPLKITERSHGVGAEDPIDATAVKAEARQASLEVDDVVPTEIRYGQLQ